jgi:Capsular polysaccharide synthesis, CpsB/CapC
MPSTADTRVDLHFHVLPGVDDGPATLEDSLRIAQLAVRDGTRLAVATPHVRSDHLVSVDHLHERVRALQDELDPLSRGSTGFADPRISAQPDLQVLRPWSGRSLCSEIRAIRGYAAGI